VGILIHASRPGGDLKWVEKQVAAQHDQGILTPIALLVDPDDADRALELVRRLDLQGYIPTSETADVVAAALRLIIAGGTYIPHSQVAGRHFLRTKPTKLDVDEGDSVDKLTARETAVLRLLEVGMANKAIARQLGVSLSTVKIHVHHIIKKFKVKN